MARKGVLPENIMFFGMLVLGFIVVIVLFIFFSGFLEKGTDWIVGAVGKIFENLWRSIPFFGQAK